MHANQCKCQPSSPPDDKQRSRPDMEATQVRLWNLVAANADPISLVEPIPKALEFFGGTLVIDWRDRLYFRSDGQPRGSPRGQGLLPSKRLTGYPCTID